MMPWFTQIDATGYELALGTLPGDVIDDCSAQGSVDNAVEYWVEKLNFDGPVDGVRAYLKSTGAWDDDELNDHTANRRRLLWIVACDEKENLND